MAGNVWEWMADCWHDSYQEAPEDGTAWNGACEGDWYAERGGGYDNPVAPQRAAQRFPNDGNNQYANMGARCARGLP